MSQVSARFRLAPKQLRLFLAPVLLLFHAVSGMATFPSTIQTVCDVDFPTCVDGIQGLHGARGVVVSPDDQHVYVVSSIDNAVVVFSRDASDGRLTHLQTLLDSDPGINGLSSASGIAISPGGEHLYTAAALDSAVAVWSRNAITGAIALTETLLDGTSGIDGLAGAHSVAVSPAGEHVYVVGRDDSAIAVFSRDTSDGRLTFLEAEFDGVGQNDGLGGAESVRVSPDGKHVYVASEIDSAVAVFARVTDPGAVDFGELTFVEAEFDGVGTNDGLAGAGSVALDSNGDNVYVASERGILNGIAGDDWAAVFSRDSSTGELTFVESFDESDFNIFSGCTGIGNENSGIAVSPDDTFVLLTNPFFGTVASFTRDPADGSLTFFDSVCDRSFGSEGLAGVIGIAVSSDGARAYTASSAYEVVATLCTGDPDLDLTDTGVVSGQITEIGCRSITAGGTLNGYQIVEPGTVAFLAPEVRLTPGFSVEVGAEFSVASSPLGPLEDPLAPQADILYPGKGDGILPALQVAIGYRLEDDQLIDSYQLSAGGDVLLSETAVNEMSVEGEVAWVPPGTAQVGDTFLIQLDVTDINGKTDFEQITVEVPSGTQLTGDQNLDSSFDGQSLVLVAGTFTVIEPLSLVSLSLLNGVTVTAGNEGQLELSVSGRVQVSHGAGIDVSELGFAGGTLASPGGEAPSGVSGAQPDAGGSHGGTGDLGNGGGPPGEVYDSVYLPSLAGGGGADNGGTSSSAFGLPGGGVVLLDVDELVLNGEIRARGTSATGGNATGAGGTVRVTTESLSGSGLIDVSGGDQPDCTSIIGVGGGGRVALLADVLDGFDPATQVKAWGGINGCSPTWSSMRAGAAGTVYVSQPGATLGRLMVDAGEYPDGTDRPTLATALPTLGIGPVASVEVSGSDLWVTGGTSFLTRWLGARMVLMDGAGVDLGAFVVRDLDQTGRALLAGAGSVIGATSYRGEHHFSTIEQLNGGGLSATDPLQATDVLIQAGESVLPRQLSAVDVTLSPGAIARAGTEGIFEATVSGVMTIEAGALLDVTGQGFAGGTLASPGGEAPGGISGAQPDGGGSHGGTGDLGNGGGPPGEVYDSVYLPSLAGGGGADNGGTSSSAFGLPGGGVVLLDVDELVLNGEIRARGTSATGGNATGAGGTVRVTTERLSGSGLIDVSGGDQPACTSIIGVGAGGRVALLADVLDSFDPATQVKAWGGINGCSANSSSMRAGAAGTVFVLTAADTAGELIVAHAGLALTDAPYARLPSIGSGSVGEVVPDSADPTALWIEPAEIVLGEPVLFDNGVVGMSVRVDGSDYHVIDQSADREQLLLADAVGEITPGELYEGLYKFDRLAVRGGATLVFLDPVEVPVVEVDVDSFLVHLGGDEEFRAIADCAPTSGPAPLSVMMRSRGEFSGGVIDRYRWDFDGDGVFDTDDETPVDSLQLFDTVGTTVVFLEVRNNFGAIALDSCLVAAHGNAPTAQAEVSPSNGVAPLTVSFTCTGNDPEGPIALYEWDFDGDGTFDYSSPTSGSTNATYNTVGEFVAVCRVTDADGQTGLAATADTVVRVSPPGSPTVEATADPTTGSAPLDVDFSGSATGTIVLWEWDFEGDGVYDFSSAVGPDTTHTYSAAGLFPATLRVTNDQALTAIDNVGIFVEADATLSIPDDTFDPSAGETAEVQTSLTGDAAVRLLIEDEAGVVRRVLADEIRSAGSYSDFWDGTDDLGSPLPHGPYFAVLEYVVASETRFVDHADLTGGFSYKPTRPPLPSVFYPLENDPLEIDFTIAATEGASEVIGFVGIFSTGERLVTLINREPFGVGTHQLVWDGTDPAGNIALPPPGEDFLVGLLAYTLADNAIMLEAAPTISDVTIAPNLFDPATPDFIAPGNPLAEITYSLDKPADVELTVINLTTGVVLRQIVDSQVAAGSGHVIGWDGRAADGRFADRGTYRLTLRAIDSAGSVSIARYALVRVFY